MGFWEPHTSSIDFCERNYEHSYHIAEMHNTWSSLAGVSTFGLIGLIWGNPTKEIRYTLAYLLLVLIGIGSAGLHGTLHWIFQSSDELPMVYLATLYNYMSFEIDSKRGQLHYPRMPLVLTIILLADTVVYYVFQHIYAIFIITYGASHILNIYLLYQLVHKKKAGGEMAKRIYMRSRIGFCFIAFPIWVLDMTMCDWFLANMIDSTFGMTLHIVWHFMAGYGAYCLTVTLEHCRMVSLGMPCDCDFWLFGLIPVNRLIAVAVKLPVPGCGSISARTSPRDDVKEEEHKKNI
jgi:dihydroceramidase